jgi:regulatory protein
MTPMAGRRPRSSGRPSSGGRDSEDREPLDGGTITALAVRTGRSDRTVVHLDGVPAFELATAVAQLADLRVGRFLSPEALSQLEHEDQPYRARSRALALLTTRDRSSREVGSRLTRLGFAPDVVAGTIEWLVERGYVDDERFVERYSAEKLRAGWALRRVRTELARQGLERELVDRVLEATAEDDEAVTVRDDALLDTLRRRFAGQLATDRKAAERRMTGFLARRGYDWPTIDRMTRRLREEAGGEDDGGTYLDD